MAGLFRAGAEESNILSVWDNVDTTNFELIAKNASNPSVVVYPRTGAGMYRLQGIRISKTLDSHPTSLYVGFAHMITSAVPTVAFVELITNNSTVNNAGLNVRADASGVLRLYRAGSLLTSSLASSYQFNVWHYFELYGLPRNTGGQFVLKVDGTIVAQALNTDTTENNEWFEQLALRGPNTGVPCYFDDVVVNDASGSVLNTWPGPNTRLFPVRVRGNGNTNQMARAGLDLGSNAAHADWREADGSVLQASAPNQTELFTIETPTLPAGAVIQSFTPNVKGRVYAGAGSGAPLAVVGANESEGDTIALSAAWKNLYAVMGTKPGGGAWTEADFANTQIGVRSK
jgi:hypothetical protein